MNYRCRILLNPFGDTSAGNSTSASSDERIIQTDSAAARDQGAAILGDGVAISGAGAVGAAASGQAAQGQAITAKDEAIAQGGQGNKNIIGTDLSGNSLGSGATLQVGYNASDLNSALSNVGSTLTTAISQQSSAGKTSLDAVLSRVADLAESKQTSGDSGRNNIILYVVLGVLALLGVFIWKGSK
jgi:hypothetical protein